MIPREPFAAAREQAAVLHRDVRHALRMMRRAPAFTALAIAMLALGTGANVAMFTVIDAVLLRSPFRDPERLAMVSLRQEDGRFSARVPAERYAELAASPRTLVWRSNRFSRSRPC